MYETTINLCLTSTICYIAYQGLEASNWILGGIEPQLITVKAQT
jgi:hypothetical protein